MAGEFTEGYQRSKRMKIKKPELLNPEQTLQQMQHEMLYLRQEVEFLKKVLKKDKDP